MNGPTFQFKALRLHSREWETKERKLVVKGILVAGLLMGLKNIFEYSFVVSDRLFFKGLCIKHLTTSVVLLHSWQLKWRSYLAILAREGDSSQWLKSASNHCCNSRISSAFGPQSHALWHIVTLSLNSLVHLINTVLSYILCHLFFPLTEQSSNTCTEIEKLLHCWCRCCLMIFKVEDGEKGLHAYF